MRLAQALFAPRAVALVGASGDARKNTARPQRYLRKHGYVIAARNYRTPNSRSELDMIGWDGDTLCFIEVKTRTFRDELLPAESAVDFEKQRDLCRVAREFLRKSRKKADPPFRFDIVTVYLEPGTGPQIAILKDAFTMV